MNTKCCKISVIIPCYNQGCFLKETCESLISQNYGSWEALIINDGSTDDTEKIALAICKEDSRFKYLYKGNGGLSSARNLGLDNVNGDYVQFLDADDKLKESKFTDSMKLIEQEKSEIVITNFLRFKSKNGKLKKVRFNLNDYEINYKSVLLNWDVKYAIPIHCGLFSVNSIKGVRFNESLKAKEDWLFWLELLKRNPKISFLNKKLTLYRAHKNNMSKNNDKMFLNWRSANDIIYESLDEEYKVVFFKRLNDELLKSRVTYYNFKDKLFSRRLLLLFKNVFS